MTARYHDVFAKAHPVARKRDEHCQAPACEAIDLQAAHMFGRGRGSISEPWCHSVEFIRMLCMLHHQYFDSAASEWSIMRDDLRWRSLYDFGLQVGFTRRPDDDNPLNAARALNRWLRKKYPDPTIWLEETKIRRKAHV